MNDEQIKALEGHTPGPWEVQFSLIASKSEKKSIVQFGFEIKKAGDRVKADAALIAAAPDLLAEVKRLRSQADFLSYELVNAPQYKAQRDKLAEAVEAYKVADCGTEEAHFAYQNLMKALEEVTE